MRLKLYWLIWKSRMSMSLQELSSTKTAGLAFMLGKFIRYFFLLFSITQVGNQVKVLNGYTVHDLVLFFLTYNLVDLLAQLFFRGVYWFRQEVNNGYLDFILLKPINPLFQSLVGHTDPLDIPLLFLVIFMLVINFPSVSFFQFLMFLLTIIISFLIMASFHIIVLAFGIITMEVENLIMLFRDLWLMGRVPVDIYTQPLRFILTFIIPVGIIMNLPAKVLINLISLPYLLIALLISFIFFQGSLFLWRYSLRKYTSASS